MKETLPNDPVEDIESSNEEIIGKLIPVRFTQLTRSEKVSLKFSQLILGLLVAKKLIRPVSILVAQSLPLNPDIKLNAFKNVYSYDSINRILYLKREMLNSTPGAVSVAVQHACAHIKIGDLRSDNNPKFRIEFYNFLAEVAGFLFKVRSDSTISTPTIYSTENNQTDPTTAFQSEPEKLYMQSKISSQTKTTSISWSTRC